jgi:hypothetical protein
VNGPPSPTDKTFPIRHRVVIAVLCSILSVGFLLGTNLSAKWWIVDDHEIVWNIGSAERLAIKDFVPKLMRTEVGATVIRMESKC